MPTRDFLSVVYATDEDIAVRASDDYTALCPPSQKVAAGVDGVFAAGDLWTLTSASVDFEAAGVAAQNIVRLSKPAATFKGQGELLAVDVVAGHSITLRRYGMPAGVGQPPSPPGGLTAVEFTILTFYPQIEAKSWDLDERYNIDSSVLGRTPADLYEVRELRDTCVTLVLLDRYRSISSKDDPQPKQLQQELDELLIRRDVRWGKAGTDQPSSMIFGARLSR